MKYPIGIQDFEEVRRGGYAYVDKTALVHTSVRFELKGDSMRRKKQQKSINSEKND